MITIKKYYGKTCAPCLSMGRIIDKVKKTHDITIQEIEVNDNPELADSANVKKIPTIVIEKSGLEVYRFDGVKSSKELKSIIDLYA